MAAHDYRTTETADGDTIFECSRCDAAGFEPSRFSCDAATDAEIHAEVADRRREARRGWPSVGA